MLDWSLDSVCTSGLWYVFTPNVDDSPALPSLVAGFGILHPIVSCKGKPRLPFGVDGGYGFGRMPFLRDRLPREAWGKEGQGLPNLDS